MKTENKSMGIEEFLDILPRVLPAPDFDMSEDTVWRGIKAITYDGADYLGKKTKVFAHVGYPEGKEGERVPAVVLVHGGGGHAYPEWIRRWCACGFAAIAMDTTGYVPTEARRCLFGNEEAHNGDYTRTLYGSLAEDGYTVGPDNSRMQDCDLPLADQWMYHAVVDTILAHNILLADDRIDPERIGISGISWGSVIASLAIGYDTRYAFAIPVYGSGHLDHLPAPKLPTVFREEGVKRLWSAHDRFGRISFPILWHCYLLDTAFTVGANSLSYLDTKAHGACFSISPDMEHSHECAWVRDIGYRFAERTVNGALPLIRPVREPSGFSDIAFPIEIPEDFSDVSAELWYLTEPIAYDEQSRMTATWQTAEATVLGDRVTADIPEGVTAYFLNLRGYAEGKVYETSTALVVRDRPITARDKGGAL